MGPLRPGAHAARLARAALLAVAALVLTGVPLEVPIHGQAGEVQPPAGRVLASVSGQVAWLNFDAPRPRVLTEFPRPAYPTSIAGVDGLGTAVAAVYTPFGGDAGWGGDLYVIDLAGGRVAPLAARTWRGESLDGPAWLPGGGGLLYHRAFVAATAYPDDPVTHAAVELIGADGSGPSVVVGNAAWPAPSPDGTRMLYVRPSGGAPSLRLRTLADGNESELIRAGPFAAIAHPRFSPDGQRIAFMATTDEYARRGEARTAPGLRFGPAVASAHGPPWDLWLMGADGSGAHAVAGVQAEDASVAWAPDGSQVFVYGRGGSVLVDAATGATLPLSYLRGYGGVAWLPV